MLGLHLHHVGYAVPDIEQSVALYVRRYGYETCSPIIHDATQTAYVQFIRLPADRTYLEFVTPDSPHSKLSNAIKKGGGLHHLCYSVTDIESTAAALRDSGMLTLCEPVPAVAFGGRRIAWLMGHERFPVELVEHGVDGEL